MKIADGANQIKIASLFLRSGLDCSHCGDFDLQRKGAEREDMPMGIAQHPGYVDHLQAVIGLGTARLQIIGLPLNMTPQRLRLLINCGSAWAVYVVYTEYTFYIS